MKQERSRRFDRTSLGTVLCLAVIFFSWTGLAAQTPDKDIAGKLKGFDAYMAGIIKDWNVPGIGVAIVSGDKLVFAKGYGYRDLGKKLPYTTGTMQQIASNTKLFTAVAAGLLVDEGKLTWDEPVRKAVPAINFYNDQLDMTVTLRDMLAHRTGITRHDAIWYQADLSRKELFERTKYLEPSFPIRQTFLYNNLMYAAAGYIIELKSGKTWEEFVRERILVPLKMTRTSFSIADMLKQPEFAVPYNEKRDSFELYKADYCEDMSGVAPCGAIVSNMEDMSHWLIALMNEGKYEGRQVIPANVLKATLEPSIALPNTEAEASGYWEVLNTNYGLGRWTASYRGRLLAFHGGDLTGFHSQISMMPRERIGVIVFVIGDHCASLYNAVSYNVYERLLGLDQTPWSARWLEKRLLSKKADTESRSKAGSGRVAGTRPSHALAEYVGDYEHPAYGTLKVGTREGALQLDFHKVTLPLEHFHYDRFDTPDHEVYGKMSVNFRTNPQGDVEKAVMSLDEAEAVFTRKPEKLDAELLEKLAGTYVLPNGVTFEIVLKNGTDVYLRNIGQEDQKLTHYKGLKFRIEAFSDVIFEFVVENGTVKALKQIIPAGEYVFPKK